MGGYIFPSLLILILCEKDFGFQQRNSGSELISIYGDYFIIMTPLKRFFKLIEIYSWRKGRLVVTKV